MRVIALIILIMIFGLYVVDAQTSINDIINQYTKVTAIDSCRNTLLVQSSAPFKKGERALIIQMKGAQINESNSTSFGNLFSMRGAGNYEINTVDSVFGNTILFKNKFINDYNTAFYVQLVTIPKYTKATVSDTLRASKWNGNIGGIIVLEADELTLNAPIDASGAGFRGGKAQTTPDASNQCSWIFTVADYHLPKNIWRSSEKGEGIADFIAGKEWGRGALATGGGGGNDHNAGGGGGANIGNGGNGGRNEDKNSFACTGPNPGIGGKEISITNALNHLFLGGGGGAGHGNNGIASSGGTGGGIILLFGKKLIANNFHIKTNGISAKSTNGDGGGGGGAGGTILFDFEEIQGTVYAEVKGGQGATIDNLGGNRCFGPGGGGSGGRVIYTSPLVVTGDFSGGKNGISTNGSCQNAPNGAQSGEDGYDELFPFINVASEKFESLIVLKQPQSDTICEDGKGSFILQTRGVDVEYQWQVSTNGGAFVNLADNLNVEGVNTSKLQLNYAGNNIQNTEYRCIITNSCGVTLVTEKVKFYITKPPKADFDLSLVNNQIVLTNKSENSDAYYWDFGDGQSSIFANPIHLFTTDGKYTIELSATNNCGIAFKSQIIEIVTPPKAEFIADTIRGCAPMLVNFLNLSSQNVNQYKWTFEGGDIKTSVEKNPYVNYLKSGIYGVTLEVVNSKYNDITTKAAYIIVGEMPKADFSFMPTTLANVAFSNLSSADATSYRWDFGDATFSIEKNPTHNYAKDGNYTVTLTTTNGCGSNIIVKTVKVELLPKAAFISSITKGCAPFLVQFTGTSTGSVGQWSWRFPGAVVDTSSTQNPRVTYLKRGTYDVFLTVKNSAGKDSITKKGIITVNEKPTADFAHTLDLLAAKFENKSENYTSIAWDFGNNAKSTAEKPNHNYTKAGSYNVSLEATNECGTTITQKSITVVNKLDCEDLTVKIVPNPVYEVASLQFNAGRYNKLSYILSTIDGRVIRRGEFDEDTLQFSFDFYNLSSGVYVLYMKCDSRVLTQKIMVTKE